MTVRKAKVEPSKQGRSKMTITKTRIKPSKQGRSKMTVVKAKIKPLLWKDTSDHHGVFWEAKAASGQYGVMSEIGRRTSKGKSPGVTRDTFSARYIDEAGDSTDFCLGDGIASLKKAKAFCEKHYARRHK
jgi:hypothetical protein